jgi:hypothetical protein
MVGRGGVCLARGGPPADGLQEQAGGTALGEPMGAPTYQLAHASGRPHASEPSFGSRQGLGKTDRDESDPVTKFALPVLFRPSVEFIGAEENDAILELETLFLSMAHRVAQQEGVAHRAVHAKGHALVRGTFQVHGDLPPELAHGLFAKARCFEALVRFSSPPAEQLPDTVSTPRALALKVLHVEGERAAGSLPGHSQDFLMVNGPAFTAPTPAGFVGPAKLLAATTEKMPRTKTVISATLRGAEAALEAVGLQSGKLKGLGGEPQRHPLGETYFTQVPFLYGPYMAKFSLAPLSPALQALAGTAIPNEGDAQRQAIQSALASEEALWAFNVQLCRDLERMPIEDASIAWPEEVSPWITVATLALPPQRSWSGLSEQTEKSLAFSPWNALAAHRPLGAVNRARKRVMAVSRQFRSNFNRCPITEPDGSN